MNIHITSTDQITHMDGVAVRVWEGITEGGIACKVFVHRLAVAVTDDSRQFEAELLICGRYSKNKEHEDGAIDGRVLSSIL